MLEAGGPWLLVLESMNLVQIDSVLVFVEAIIYFIKSSLKEGIFSQIDRVEFRINSFLVNAL